MNALLAQFLSEAREALEGIGDKLMQLEAAPDNEELMVRLFRLVHTLKGNSGLFDFPEMTRVLHAGEDLMDAVRNDRLRFSQSMADRLLDAMDFVGRLCDAVEEERAPAAGVSAEAIQITHRLRELLGNTTSDGSTSIDSPPTYVGCRRMVTRLSADWIAQVPAAIWASAASRATPEAPLLWLRYTPATDCFFHGEDPMHLARQTPGFAWGGMRPRAQWPALHTLDAYQCMLDFDILVVTSLPEIEAHFRYGPDQVQIFEPMPSKVQDDALAQVLAVQRDILALDDDDAWLLGRIKAAVASLSGCLRARSRAAELPALNAAADAALRACSAAPMAEWMASAFPIEPALPAESIEVQARSERRSDDVPGAKSLKVDQAKIDRMMNLIGEMVVAKNAIPFLANRAERVFGVRELAREIKGHYAVINRIAEEMQDAIMQVRMMPVSFIFQRFPRLVRDTSRRLGKQISLVLEGEDTAADKNIIESLGDPLVHIVRNSLDHGFESLEVRLASGKAATGTLRIRARQENNRVLIEISDDGRGIDPDVIKHKAFEKGLIDQRTMESLSDQDAVNLVFLAGFSTADTVSDLSGRGVGMDVVRTAIERVDGSVTIDSTKGQGTCICISLPLSMAVTKVMTIESDGQAFGIPMDRVVETVRLSRSAVRGIKQNLVTVLRGRVVPLKSLNSLLGLAAAPLANDHDELAVLVVRTSEGIVGLLVDDFRETADIILKPLRGVLTGMKGYAGSALLGDGAVLMVLDIKEMV